MSKPPKKKPNAAATKGDPRDIKLSQHPRAQRQIRRAKGWGALAGCALAAYLSWHGGAPFVDTALRAVAWGIVSYVVVWACAQQVWRHLALAELATAEKIALERRRQAEAELRALEAEQAEPETVAMPGGP